MDSVRDRWFLESIKNCRRYFQIFQKNHSPFVNFVLCCKLTKISIRFLEERFYYRLLHTKASLLHLKVKVKVNNPITGLDRP
jgi:hypothetical protein